MMKNIVFIFMSILILSCTPKKMDVVPVYEKKPISSAKPVIRFAIHPLHNPERLLEVFGPIINYLDQNISEVNFELEASINYHEFEDKIARKELHFILPNPYQTMVAQKNGYHVFGKMGDDDNFRGIIIVRKDSHFKSIQDLKGKFISYPAPTALAATMMPQYFLKKNGLNVLKDTKSIYAGSQESSILNVYLKTSSAGCTWPPPWIAFVKNNPDKAKDLEIKWTTTTLPNNSLMARDDIPKELVEKVAALLFNLHNSNEGKKLLSNISLSKFEKANESTYAPVKAFIAKFTKEIRLPEQEK